MFPLVPTTLLEAVNAVLEVIEEAPVTTLDSPDPDAQRALRIINEASRSVQAEGWAFNTATNIALFPDASGRIPVPANAARCSGYLIQAGFLATPGGDSFGGPVTVPQMVVLLGFEELPQTARNLVALTAAWVMLARHAPDAATAQMLKADIDRARIELVREDTNLRGLTFQLPAGLGSRQRLTPESGASPEVLLPQPETTADDLLDDEATPDWATIYRTQVEADQATGGGSTNFNAAYTTARDTK